MPDLQSCFPSTLAGLEEEESLVPGSGLGMALAGLPAHQE